MAGSFLFPFRGGPGRWLPGLALLVVLPIGLVPVFGYAVGCVRAAACSRDAAPPRWRLSGRLLSDGAWSALQAAAVTLPFAALAWLLAGLLGRAWHPVGDPVFDRALALVLAGTLSALPWGVAAMLVVPPTLARFALSGRPADLADPRAVVACLRERYAAWNLVVVAITTVWALAVACLALAGVGVVAGAFYAILVSAHACAALCPDRPAR